MPGEGGINAIEGTGTGHEHLAAAELLTGAAEVVNRTLDAILFHVVLDSHSGSQRTGAQQVMTAAMTITALTDGSMDIVASLLAQTGQSIELAEQSDCRMTFAPDTDKSGGNASQASGDLEAFAFQGSNQGSSGFLFLKAQFGCAPDLVCHIDKLIGLFVHQGFDLLNISHYRYLR